MTAMNNLDSITQDKPVVMTSTHGRVSPTAINEPHPGSVVLTEGVHGTAWQRLFSDGLWHRVGRGSPKTWDQILSKRNVVLVYDAEERA